MTIPQVEISLLISVIVLVAAIAASWASLKQHLIDKEIRDNARFDRLEKKVGISNGGAEWMSKELCRAVHVAFSQELAALKVASEKLAEAVEEATEQGREAIDVGHRDREAIKARLSKVEDKVDLAADNAAHAVEVARTESAGIQARLLVVETKLK